MARTSLYFTLLLFFIEELTFIYTYETELGDSLLALEKLSKPFVAWARSIADNLNDKADIADILLPSVSEVGKRINDGTASQKMKSELAADLHYIATSEIILVQDMFNISTAAKPILEAVF